MSTQNRSGRLPCALAVALMAATYSTAQRRLDIRLGTLAPRNSSYHQCLQDMGEAWRMASDGLVRVRIFPGGNLGGEAEMVRQMTIGDLQAGLVTGVGLSDVEPGISGMQSVPMMFQTLEEVDYVNRRLAPLMGERLRERGFVVLFWTDAGWVRLFTTTPTLEPADLQQRRLFAWQGNPPQVEIMANAGYHPVSLETGDIVTSLRTGLIEAAHVPPIFALACQLDSKANHMLELNWAPLIGALVIERRAWEAIPAALHETFRAAAEETGRALRARGREESDRAVAAMQARGLVVHPVTQELEELWRAEAERVYPQIRGRIVPADIFDKVQALLVEYRDHSAEAPLPRTSGSAPDETRGG